MGEHFFVPFLIVLPLIAFWLWMAWDLGGNGRLSSNEKTYWIIGFLFLNVFAAVMYYVYVYRKRQ